MTVALGASFAGGPGIAYADDAAGSSPSSNSSSEGSAPSGSSGIDTAKPATTPDEPDAPPSPPSATTGTTATFDVTDSHADLTPDGDAAPSDSTSSTEDSADDNEDPTTTDDSAGQPETGTETSTGESPTDPTAADQPNPQEDAVAATEEPAAETVVDEPSVLEFADPLDVVDASGVSDPGPTDFIGTSATFAYRTGEARMDVASLSPLAVPAFPNPLALIGTAIDYTLAGIHNRMNPLISAVLGVYSLQTGINQIQSLHLIGGALNLTLGVLSFATVAFGVIPVPGTSLLIPVTATLATGLVTVNTIGSGLFHW